MTGRRPVRAWTVSSQVCDQAMSCVGVSPPVSSRSNIGASAPGCCIRPVTDTKYRAWAAAEPGVKLGRAK